MHYCATCGSNETDYDPAKGDTVCVGCGTVIEENTIVSEVQFAEDANGASSVVGQFISASGTGMMSSSFAKESREITISNGRRRISHIAGALSLNSHHVEAAQRFFLLAVQHNFIQGRRTQHVVAACLYIVCRREKTPHMLIDFSDVLQTNVFSLGSTFLKFTRLLSLRLPLIDPSLYIHRFASRLELGDKMHVVSMLALRLVQRMKRDWIQTGRRPSGICGAALLVAARVHGFRRTQRELVHVVRICDVTLRKRLCEFEETACGALTAHELGTVDLEALEEANPPAFTAARRAEAIADWRALHAATPGALPGLAMPAVQAIACEGRNPALPLAIALPVDCSALTLVAGAACAPPAAPPAAGALAGAAGAPIAGTPMAGAPGAHLLSTPTDASIDLTEIERTAHAIDRATAARPAAEGARASAADGGADGDDEAAEAGEESEDEEREEGEALTIALGTAPRRRTAAAAAATAATTAAAAAASAASAAAANIRAGGEPEGGDGCGDLSELSDGELDGYLIQDSSELSLRAELWSELNHDWILKKAEKDAEAATAAANGDDPARRTKRRRTRDKGTAASAAEAVEHEMNRRRVSTHLNYDALNTHSLANHNSNGERHNDRRDDPPSSALALASPSAPLDDDEDARPQPHASARAVADGGAAAAALAAPHAPRAQPQLSEPAPARATSRSQQPPRSVTFATEPNEVLPVPRMTALPLPLFASPRVAPVSPAPSSRAPAVPTLPARSAGARAQPVSRALPTPSAQRGGSLLASGYGAATGPSHAAQVAALTAAAVAPPPSRYGAFDEDGLIRTGTGAAAAAHADDGAMAADDDDEDGALVHTGGYGDDAGGDYGGGYGDDGAEEDYMY